MNREKNIQDKYELKEWQSAKKIIIFLVPPDAMMAGGIMSIFYCCQFSRNLNRDGLCIISTPPGERTYAKNNQFENDEKIYRWDQVMENTKKSTELFIHIPECWVKRFYKDLTMKDIVFLKKHRNLKLNILNQNIDLMPKLKYINRLLNLTDKVTHSTGFLRYTSQEICDLFGLPLYYIPSYINLDYCVRKPFSDKQKLILYSNDFNIAKQKIIEHLEENLKDFQIREINGITYDEFLELISNALFCISFCEGFDGYYIQPYYARSIGVSVYNEKFFPSSSLKSFPFVYDSYDELYEKIVDDIKIVCDDPERYERVVGETHAYFVNNINKNCETINGLERLYNNKHMFLPDAKFRPEY